MKILGLQYPQFQSAVASVDTHLHFNVQGDCTGTPGIIEGYLFYKQSYNSPWKCKVQGETHHKPCGHMGLAVVKALLETGATTVWLEKLSFKKGYGSLHTTKLFEKLQAKGVTCHCPVQGPTIKTSAPVQGPSAWIGTGAKPQTPPVTPTKLDPITLLLAKPLDGDALTGDIQGVPVGKRPTMACVTGLYTLFELDQVIDDYVLHGSLSRLRDMAIYTGVAIGAMVDSQSHLPSELWATPETSNPASTGVGNALWIAEKVCGSSDRKTQHRALLLDSLKETDTGKSRETYYFLQEYWKFSESYKATLARNLFDYLAMASMGECRHSSEIQAWTPTEPKPSGRQAAYARAATMDPRQFLPVVQNVFTKLKWSSAYGGPKWGNIAKSAGLYFKFLNFPVVFADHVVDLSHNGGLAFNKGYILDMPSTSTYMAMLDHKREHSLIRGSHPLTITREVHRMLRGVSSLLDFPVNGNVSVVDDVAVPFVKWGTGHFLPQGKVTGAINVIESELDQTTSIVAKLKAKADLGVLLETYPESRRKLVTK